MYCRNSLLVYFILTIDLFIRTTPNPKVESATQPKKIILNRKVSANITPPSTTSDSILQETIQTSDSIKNDESDDLKHEKKVVKLGALTAEERAKLRAQKFGVPIPDSVKKAVRAERFGGTKSDVAVAPSSQVCTVVN